MTAISTMRAGVLVGALALVATTAGVTVSTPAQAQDLSRLSCGQLWYERNAIFARFGYCFQTEQAVNTFGRACFPPYGKLPPNAQSRVNEIIAWERRKGCN